MADSPTIEKLQKRLEKEPNPLIFLQLAEEYRKESLYDSALKVCRDGLRKHPNYWSMRVAVGRIYFEMGDLTHSREELEKVIKAVPDNLLANKILGDIYLEQDLPAEALKRYKIVQMITPADQDVIANIHKIEGLSPQAPAAPKRSEPEPPPAMAAPPTVLIPIPIPIPMPLPPPAAIETPDLPFVEPPAFLEKTEPGVRAPFEENPVSAPPEEIHLEPAPEPEPEEASYEAIEQLMEDAVEARSAFSLPYESPVVPEESDDAFLHPTPPQMEDFSETDMASFELETLDDERPEMKAEDRTQPMEEGVVPESAPTASSDTGVEEAEELTTQTLAELYVQQGLIDKAIRVYQKLLLHEPTNAKIIHRLKELSSTEPLLSSPAVREEKARASGARSKDASGAQGRNLDQMSEERRRKISTLESWLSSIRRERS